MFKSPNNTKFFENYILNKREKSFLLSQNYLWNPFVYFKRNVLCKKTKQKVMEFNARRVLLTADKKEAL